MVIKDIKSLLLHMNEVCTNVLHNAAGYCVSRTNYEITIKHYLFKLLDEEKCDFLLILEQAGIDIEKLRAVLLADIEELKTGNSGKPVFSPLLLELLQDAWVKSSIDLEQSKTRSGALLLALLNRSTYFADGRYIDVLKPINQEQTENSFWQTTKGGSEKMEMAAAASTPSAGSGAPAGGPKGDSFLAKFCEDFTQKAADGKIDEVFGRESEIRLMIDILARRRKNNPICVGEPGVGKSAVVEGLAVKIHQGDVPPVLQGVRLLGLDMALLQAGAGMKGEFENRLRGVIEEVKSSETPIVLFIDEAHTLVGAGGSAGGDDAANLLKPALARGELKTVAATTWKEYKKYFEKDAALARRFQLVKLEEPNVETATLILRGIKKYYEQSHEVIIRDDAVVAAAKLSNKYIQGRFLPDKAIDLIDTSCARIKINLSSKPGAIEDKQVACKAIERELNALMRDKNDGVSVDEELIAAQTEKKAQLEAEAEALEAEWNAQTEAAKELITLRTQVNACDDEAEIETLREEIEAKHAAFVAMKQSNPLVEIEVNPDIIAKVVSDWTGVPLGKMLRDEAKTVLELDSILKNHIKGQDYALEEIAETVRSAKSGIRNPNQPMGVFLLVGPSGVGKTETGVQLADLLFGSQKSLVSVNLSEFQEKHTVSRLIGSPPGYVGYGEGGMITEAVRQKPYSVVLLDEVEKAHPDIMNLFYQVFDKGVLTDGEGKEINFKDTVIILTSNLASDITEELFKTKEELTYQDIEEAIRPTLIKYFKPALLARMHLIPYIPLSRAALKDITVIKLEKLRKMLLDNNKVKFEFSNKAVEQIVARCGHSETGARNIEFIINDNILPSISKAVLTSMTEGDMPELITLDLNENKTFKIGFNEPLIEEESNTQSAEDTQSNDEDDQVEKDNTTQTDDKES